MPTAREIARQQRQARRDRERDARKADRERLRQLRSHIKAAKGHARTRMKEVVRLCRRGRARARELGKLANIPPELVPVWREVKGRIKSTPRRTRTETFLEWSAEHSGDVLAIIDRALQRDVANMIAEEKTLRQHVGRPTHYGKLSDAELVRKYERYHGAPEVPF